MSEIKSFLEASSIHGVLHIAQTKKYQRLLWMLIVITGFTSAIFLIHQSFKSWDESPIKTTIETLSISKLRFPKITVCPPKNTYTNLNYDLMKSENITITIKARQELIDYFYELNHDETFFNILTDLDLITNENRYFDWYHGYTELALPDKVVSAKTSKVIQSYKFNTSSASGNISTKHFGEKFDGQKVQKELLTLIEFYFDDIPRENNITFFFNLKRESIMQLRNGLDSFMFTNWGLLPNDRKSRRTTILGKKQRLSSWVRCICGALLVLNPRPWSALIGPRQKRILGMDRQQL